MAGEKRVNLEVAERQLDRVQSFFPRIDSRVAALFAISSAQVAVAAVNTTYDELLLWWVAAPAVIFLVSTIVCQLNLYWCTYPSLNGGERSLVYFNEIAKLKEDNYIEGYLAVSEDALARDFAAQIWRNSQIVADKYRYLKSATQAAIFSVIPWTLLLAASTMDNGRISMGG